MTEKTNTELLTGKFSTNLKICDTRSRFSPGPDENGIHINQLIGISLDSSEHSKRALDWYYENIHRVDNRLALIHIHSLPEIQVTCDDGNLIFTSAGTIHVSGKWWQEAAEKSYKMCEDLLNTYKDYCESLKISYEIHLASKQKHQIGYEVLKIVEERGIQWIIMGNRGLDTIRRTMLGSVSDYILHHSPVPVTIVPPS